APVIGQGTGATYTPVTQSMAANYDPMGTATNVPTWATTQSFAGILPFPSGVAPPATGPPANYQWKIPFNSPSTAKYYWFCLRRPANPFAPVSATNPMRVVDAMRFPYVDGTGTTRANDNNGNPCTQGPYPTVYSAQRLQPYRG